ncbi:hypothetical protein MBLNU457_7734t1 [Dothideomycetes sp. NU457]
MSESEADSGQAPPLPLPEGIESTYVDCTNSCGLSFHILSSGRDESRFKPLVLLTHGYPELAFSWRKLIPSLAAKGYYVVAPDQRGYGRTTGWDTSSWEKVDLMQFTMTNLVRDLVCLVYALGYKKVHCIIGHDFGAVSSAMAPLIRPDVFTSCIQMSHPHHAPPTPPFATGEAKSPRSTTESNPTPTTIQDSLKQLDPPRKHYKWYNSGPDAADDWNNPPQGLQAFLRGYFHLKSADWAKNDPHPLKEWTAEQLSTMPHYYIMPLDSTMPQAVSASMQGEDADLTKRWLPDDDLSVYVSEWQRTGFQGALNWYRAQTSQSPQQQRDMLLFAGRKIEVPCCFISGKQDWGNY